MVKTDFEKEIKRLLLEEEMNVKQATEGICARQTWYRALENKTVIPKCIVDVLDRLGYDIEIHFIKR